VTPIYKLSDNSILDGRIIYSSMLAGNPTFVPSLTVDYLVVAGGGGGGGTQQYGGGGGAGGYRTSIGGTALTLDLDELYTVTVGAGGATNNKGNNSVFSSITSTGGGLGGNSSVSGRTVLFSGGSGGSGGGAGNRSDANNSQASPAVQGFGNQGSFSPS
jgi:hypothetical protein